MKLSEKVATSYSKALSALASSSQKAIKKSMTTGAQPQPPVKLFGKRLKHGPQKVVDNIRAEVESRRAVRPLKKKIKKLKKSGDFELQPGFKKHKQLISDINQNNAYVKGRDSLKDKALIRRMEELMKTSSEKVAKASGFWDVRNNPTFEIDEKTRKAMAKRISKDEGKDMELKRSKNLLLGTLGVYEAKEKKASAGKDVIKNTLKLLKNKTDAAEISRQALMRKSPSKTFKLNKDDRDAVLSYTADQFKGAMAKLAQSPNFAQSLFAKFYNK